MFNMKAEIVKCIRPGQDILARSSIFFTDCWTNVQCAVFTFCHHCCQAVSLVPKVDLWWATVLLCIVLFFSVYLLHLKLSVCSSCQCPIVIEYSPNRTIYTISQLVFTYIQCPCFGDHCVWPCDRGVSCWVTLWKGCSPHLNRFHPECHSSQHRRSKIITYPLISLKKEKKKY